MDICILQYLPDNTKIKLEKNAPIIFPEMRLYEMSSLLHLNIKNISRYRNQTRSIPIRTFEKLVTLSKKEFSEFQNKIYLKLGRTGHYLKIGPFIEINEDWAYISQLINGDGHITRNLWNIVFVNNNKTLIKYVYDFFRDLGLEKNHFHIIKRVDADFLIIRSALLAAILNRVLGVSIGKKGEIDIAKIILEHRDLSIAALRGAFDAEGCVSFFGTRRISITSNSHIWIMQLHKILEELRIKSRIFKEFKNRDKPIYRLLVNHIVNIKKFYDIVKPLHSKRSKKLKAIIKSFNKNYKGKFHKEILIAIKGGICRKKDISKHINQSPIITNNNICWLKRHNLIYPKEKFFTNKGIYFLYGITQKGEDFLKKDSRSFFD